MSNQRVWLGYNDLETLYPNIASQWNYKKNENLKPCDVMPHSRKEVWWHLPFEDPKTGKHYDFEWPAKVYLRTDGKGGGCPYLSSNAVWSGYNDLATTNPEIAAQWHPTKNAPLSPSDITPKSNNKYWWKCLICGSAYRATVSKMTVGQGGHKC